MQTLTEVENDWMDDKWIEVPKIVFGGKASGKSTYLVQEFNKSLGRDWNSDIKFIQPFEKGCLDLVSTYTSIFDELDYRIKNELKLGSKAWKDSKCSKIKLIHDDFDFSLMQLRNSNRKSIEKITTTLAFLRFSGIKYGISFTLALRNLKQLEIDSYSCFGDVSILYLGDSFERLVYFPVNDCDVPELMFKFQQEKTSRRACVVWDNYNFSIQTHSL